MAGVPKWKKEAQKRLLPELLNVSEENRKAYEYCVRNNIRISPIGVVDKIGYWRIGISTPDNFKKVYESPELCDKYSVWEIFYKYCKYYYEKSI